MVANQDKMPEEGIIQPSNVAPKRTTGFEVNTSSTYSHHKRPSPLSLHSASLNPFTAQQLAPTYTYDGNLSIDPAMLSQQIRSHPDSMASPSSQGQTSGRQRSHRRGSGYNHSSMELISESLMDMVQYAEAKQEPHSATLASPSQTSSGSSGNYTPYGHGNEGQSNAQWVSFTPGDRADTYCWLRDHRTISNETLGIDTQHPTAHLEVYLSKASAP